MTGGRALPLEVDPISSRPKFELAINLKAANPGKDGYTIVYCTKGQFKNYAA